VNESFNLVTEYQPTGDQPAAIKGLVNNFSNGEKEQVLLGVTGSGKTFTMANVIQQLQKPTLVLAHNKTLAAQLYNEFKNFFPDNEVHYFVSYFDYYQPEAYIARSDTYIEKDSQINEEIDPSETYFTVIGIRDFGALYAVERILKKFGYRYEKFFEPDLKEGEFTSISVYPISADHRDVLMAFNLLSVNRK